jgi:flavin-dependent dehydrogenase
MGLGLSIYGNRLGMKQYQVAIVGGGLAGLSLSITLARAGLSVALVESGNYPRHKVCGEYVSMESYRFLCELCPELEHLNLPKIKRFQLTATGKSETHLNLDLGGLGISRFLLENLLYEQAMLAKVDVLTHTKAHDVVQRGSNFLLDTMQGTLHAQLVCGSFGKKSVMEKALGTGLSWKQNYVGVKYHVKTNHPEDLIAIHSFPGGYCGISNVESGVSCLCYIVNSNFLNRSENSIEKLERLYLDQNSNLKHIFNTGEFLWEKPLVISNIHFGIQATEKQHVLLLGDAAGCIAPITGNGMSMALRGSWYMAQLIVQFFAGKITRQQLEEDYLQYWAGQFSTRIRLSRHLQKLAEVPALTNMAIGLFNFIPGLGNGIVKLTHGKPF